MLGAVVGMALCGVVAVSSMRVGRFRRLPVVDSEQRLIGLVTLDDVMDFLARGISDVGRELMGMAPD